LQTLPEGTVPGAEESRITNILYFLLLQEEDCKVKEHTHQKFLLNLEVPVYTLKSEEFRVKNHKCN
jgi:hypothetical protein